MFRLHCTKKLLDRIKPEIVAPGPSDTALGNWYATVLFWKPQVALLVSERTLLPVLMPLAPAATLARRFPAHLALILKEHGAPSEFIAQEVWRMDQVRYAKTANRSVVGILSEFVKQADEQGKKGEDRFQERGPVRSGDGAHDTANLRAKKTAPAGPLWAMSRQVLPKPAVPMVYMRGMWG